MTTLVLLIVDAVILMCLMQFLVRENVGLLSSFIAAVIGALAAMLLTNVFTPAGPNAAVVAGLLVAIGVGIGIYFVFHVGFINAIIIGVIFLVVRSGIYYLLGALMRA